MKTKEIKVGKNDFVFKDSLFGILMSLLFICGAISIFVCLFCDIIEKTDIKFWGLAAFILFIGIAFLCSQITTIKQIKQKRYTIYLLPVQEKNLERVTSRFSHHRNEPPFRRRMHHFVYMLFFDIGGRKEKAFVKRKVYHEADVGSMFYVIVVEGNAPVCYSAKYYRLSEEDALHLKLD